MDINELKSNWQKSNSERKSQTELQRMTRIKNHPKLKRTKIKFIIEVVLLVIFLAVYHNILDGGNKPLWLNIILVISIVFYIANDITGYLALLHPVQGNNIVTSLENLKVKLRRVSIVSLLISMSFAFSLILFLTINIHFTTSKYVLLTGMILTLLIMTYISYQTWISRISQINQSMQEFTESAN
jgi:hypothetical protein